MSAATSRPRATPPRRGRVALSLASYLAAFALAGSVAFDLGGAAALKLYLAALFVCVGGLRPILLTAAFGIAASAWFSGRKIEDEIDGR